MNDLRVVCANQQGSRRGGEWGLLPECHGFYQRGTKPRLLPVSHLDAAPSGAPYSSRCSLGENAAEDNASWVASGVVGAGEIAPAEPRGAVLRPNRQGVGSGDQVGREVDDLEGKWGEFGKGNVCHTPRRASHDTIDDHLREVIRG